PPRGALRRGVVVHARVLDSDLRRHHDGPDTTVHESALPNLAEIDVSISSTDPRCRRGADPRATGLGERRRAAVLTPLRRLTTLQPLVLGPLTDRASGTRARP